MTGFTFFQNYYDAISDEDNGLTEEEQGRLYNAIFAYMFRDEEPNLKGACKLAFNLIKPSLELSKVRSNAKNKNQNADEENQNETKTESSEIKSRSKKIKSESNETKTESNEIKSDSSPFFENKEERNKKDEEENISTVGHNACAREDGEIVSDYLQFMREHPEVHDDLQNQDEIASIDFQLLSQKMTESQFLRTRNSLSWLIGNYQKIISDAYKDFRRAPPKGDAQLDCLKQLYAEAVEEDSKNAEKNGC